MAKGYYVLEHPQNKTRERVPDGFNWWVFLFGPIWYFFNGLVGQGLGWFMVALLVALLTSGFGPIIVWLIAAFGAYGARKDMLLQKGW